VIQTEFKEVVVRMVYGGEAHLVLTAPEDVMESGVEIIARPPKTKLKNIAALSGGEKAMTAVSLIFAILRIKPAPFCVLDEIDAALDDANALRFCEYLLSIKNDNQFVIITHKKKTMEIADTLYGASMGKEGITELYSVRISQLDEKGEVYAG
jgi:chromosome segregation protein